MNILNIWKFLFGYFLVTPTDELIASNVLNNIQKEDAIIQISDKPPKQNNMFQNKKSFLSSPTNIDTVSKTSKDSTNSFRAFYNLTKCFDRDNIEICQMLIAIIC